MDNVVVIDYGGSTFKAGLAYNFPTDEAPRVVTPSFVYDENQPASLAEDGPSTSSSLPPTQRRRPRPVVERGLIVNWPAFESIVHNILYGQLGWEIGDEGSLLFGEPLFTTKAEREQLTQLMFEQFNVNGLFVADEAVLSLYALGKLTGSVVDFGHGKIDVSTVAEGQLVTSSARRLYGGGAELTYYLAELLAARCVSGLPQDVVAGLKERCMRVAESPGSAGPSEEIEEEEHRLPDGQVVRIGREGYRLGEAMLDSSLLPSSAGEEPGARCPVAEVLFNAAISHPDATLRKGFLENLMLCGGGSAAPGLPPRFLRELRALAPPSIIPAICPVPDYMPDHTLRHPAFMGGVVLSKVVFQQNQHISKADYDEAGPSVVNRKCG